MLLLSIFWIFPLSRPLIHCLNKKKDKRDQYNNGNKIITMDCSESQSFHQVLHNLDAFSEQALILELVLIE
jgi:hypothetical protein